MLVAFSLTNSACFRDHHELSMEAVKGTTDRFAFDTDVRQAPRLNRVAAIFGPNGSGKSRFVEGLRFARRFVLNSSRESQAGDEIPYEPFLFKEESRESPTAFETTFVRDGTLYQYGFEVDAVRVHREWLLAWPPGGKMRRLLERLAHPDTGKEEYKFSQYVRGSKSVWRDNTRPNALLVSTAVQLNSDTFRPVVDWFRELRIIRSGGLHPNYTASVVDNDQETKQRVLKLLRAADISAADVEVDKEVIDIADLKERLPPRLIEELPKDVPTTLERPRPKLVHRPGGSGAAHALDLERESDGTQRYFGFAGPWLDVLDNDRVVVVDELDRSLHPLLVASLVQQFNKEADGDPCRAQLVITVHDVTLLQEALDRGQVWLTEKDRETEAASLTPLSDYRPRKDEALMRGYLGGRYGGVPVVVRPEALG